MTHTCTHTLKVKHTRSSVGLSEISCAMVSHGYLQYWQDNGDIACPFPRQTTTVGLHFMMDKNNSHCMCSKGWWEFFSEEFKQDIASLIIQTQNKTELREHYRIYREIKNADRNKTHYSWRTIRLFSLRLHMEFVRVKLYRESTNKTELVGVNCAFSWARYINLSKEKAEDSVIKQYWWNTDLGYSIHKSTQHMFCYSNLWHTTTHLC